MVDLFMYDFTFVSVTFQCRNVCGKMSLEREKMPFKLMSIFLYIGNSRNSRASYFKNVPVLNIIIAEQMIIFKHIYAFRTDVY